MKDNVKIHINPEFIESDFTTFVPLYDIYLVRFMVQYKNYHFGDFDYKIDPKNIEEIEKDFIKTTLELLKIRREEFRTLQNKIFTKFLEVNNITSAKFNKEWDNGMGEKFGEYEHKQLSVEWSGSITFNMNIHFLLLKANKIGCLIDLKEDFKFDEPVDYTAEPDPYFDAKGSEKLVYLKELGIIDFLKEQNPVVSQNKLAKLLCILTGERHLQPGLNSMESNSPIMDRKNPYYSPKTAPKVREQLTQWGFKIITST